MQTALQGLRRDQVGNDSPLPFLRHFQLTLIDPKDNLRLPHMHCSGKAVD